MRDRGNLILEPFKLLRIPFHFILDPPRSCATATLRTFSAYPASFIPERLHPYLRTLSTFCAYCPAVFFDSRLEASSLHGHKSGNYLLHTLEAGATSHSRAFCSGRTSTTATSAGCGVASVFRPGDVPGIPSASARASISCLGDNSSVSSDSRFWGPVPVGDAIGVGRLIYWPYGRWHQFQ